MKESDQDIAKALVWAFKLLESNFRDRAFYAISAAHPSIEEWTKHSVLNECGDVVALTLVEIEKVLDA